MPWNNVFTGFSLNSLFHYVARDCTEAKRYRKTDSAGLIIEVMPNGNKVWRYRFQFGGKATIYTIGDYPAISLAKARQLIDEASR